MKLMLAAVLAGLPQASQPLPVNFTKDVSAPGVIFAGDARIHQFCDGPIVLACVRHEPRGNVLVLPNPCNPVWRDEDYARTACHELKHLNGWEHPRDRNY